VEVLVEVCEFVRQNVRVGDDVEFAFTIALLHGDHVRDEAVFACQLGQAWEVVHFLELVQVIEKVLVSAPGGPHHVPVVGLSLLERVGFKDGAYKASICLGQFKLQICMLIHKETRRLLVLYHRNSVSLHLKKQLDQIGTRTRHRSFGILKVTNSCFGLRPWLLN